MKFQTFHMTGKKFSPEQNFVKKTLNFLMNRQEDITLFSHTFLFDDIQHLVFHIPDELISGTKKGGIESSQPFSQYLNVFILEDLIFIEYIKTNYSKMLKDYLKNNHDITIQTKYFKNPFFYNILKLYNASIKSLSVTSEDGEILDGLAMEIYYDTFLELVSSLIESNYKVNSVSFQTLNSLSRDFITLDEDGSIVTNTKSEINLVTLLKDIKMYA